MCTNSWMRPGQSESFAQIGSLSVVELASHIIRELQNLGRIARGLQNFANWI